MGANSHTSRTKFLLCAAASALAIAGALQGTASAQTPTAAETARVVDLPAAPLGEAILALGRELGVNIIAPDSLVRGKTAPEISGTLTREEAIDRLLAGSGLVATANADGDFILSQQVAAEDPGLQLISNEASSVEPFIGDTVVVTGTRIERSEFNAPAPVDVVTAEEIARFGLTDNTEALRFVPALQQSLSLTSFNEFGLRDDIGSSTLNLRGLGSERTLVLVNGRRHVSGVAGEATVDVSSIPAALIDRVEVLTGGGSSIYGADAVSGVVNYVLKDDFEGIDVRGNFSLPTRGNGEAYFGALTAGSNFADDRGNVVLNVEYNRQTPIEFRERRGFATDSAATIFTNNAELSAALGVDPQFTNVVAPGGGFLTNPPFPLAVVSFNDGIISGLRAGPGQTNGVTTLQSFNRLTGELRPFNFGVRQNDFSGIGGDGANVPLNDQGFVIPDIERYLINGLASYELLDGLTGFVEVKYSSSETDSAEANFVFDRDIPIARDNPFVPTEIAAQYDALLAQDPDTTLLVGVRPNIGQLGIVSKNNRETFRIVGGVRGELSPAFAYEVSANYGRTETEVIDSNGRLLDRYYAGIDAVTDPSTGDIVCRSDLDPNAPIPFNNVPPLNPGYTTFQPGDGSCTPINIFEPVTAEQAAFYSTPFRSAFAIDQFVLNATLTGNSGDFLKLPGGGIGYAAGIEYREEQSQFSPDPLEAAGLSPAAFFGFIPTDEGGEFDVIEGFAEVNLPILANLPFAQRLDIDASIRVADYSTVGSATSWAVGGVWQPVDDLRIRASFNRAVRAPNIDELFAPQSISIDGSIFDPCSADRVGNADASEFRAANCAQLVPPGFISEIGSTPDAIITRGGNPNLQEETADTFTIGAVWQPNFVRGLTVLADYYSIEIDDAIVQGTSEDSIFNNCVDAATIDNPACAAITRDPTTGFITVVQATALNFAALRSKGIDYQINYAFNLDDLFGGNTGNFNATLAGSYLIEREDQAFAAIEGSIESRRGEGGGIGIADFPLHFINFNLNWNKGPFQVDYGLNYQSSVNYVVEFLGIDREAAQEDPFLINQPGTGDGFVHYLGGSYELTDDVIASLRVNNLFDRDPFFRASPRIQVRPTSAIGRTVQFGVQARF